MRKKALKKVNAVIMVKMKGDRYGGNKADK